LTNDIYPYIIYIMLKKSKIFKIFLWCSLFFLLAGTAVIANRLFFREIEIKIGGIRWVEEFKIEIPEIEFKNSPSILVINPNRARIEQEKLQIQKQNTEINKHTNNKILVPIRTSSEKFFIPQFRAKIVGGEKTENKDLRLRANFSLYLLTAVDKCPKDKTSITGRNFVLCDIEISSSNVMSFNITDRRKNILAENIKNLTDKNDYILALKIAPDLERIKTLSSFSITIENIVPELVIGN